MSARRRHLHCAAGGPLNGSTSSIEQSDAAGEGALGAGAATLSRFATGSGASATFPARASLYFASHFSVQDSR